VFLVNRILRPLVTFAPGKPAYRKAARVCVGFIIPLAICTAVQRPTLGVVAGMSGMLVVLGDPGGAFQRRARLAPLGVLFGAVVLLAMLMASTSVAFTVLLVGAFIFGSGFFLLYGPAGASTASPIQLMVLLGLALPGGDLGYSLTLFLGVLAGIAWGTAVILAPWPFVGNQPVRRVVAGAFEATAQLARGTAAVTADSDRELLAEGIFRESDDNRADLAVAYEKAQENERYLRICGHPSCHLLQMLEQAATAIMALSTRLNDNRNITTIRRADITVDFATLAAVFEADAVQVAGGQLPTGPPPDLPAIYALTDTDVDPVLAGLGRNLITAMADLQALGGSKPNGVGESARKTTPWIATVRSGISSNSIVFRYMVRFAITSMVAVLIFKLLDVPDGAWIFLTVVVVLKPGIGPTVDRLMQRTAGTLIGVIIAAALVGMLSGHPWLIVLAMTIALFAMVSLAPINYLFWAIAITPFVLLGIDASVPHDYPDVLWRLLNTLIGAALSLLATYVIWPSRGAQIVPSAIAHGYTVVAQSLTALIDGTSTGKARALHRKSRATESTIGQLMVEFDNEPGVKAEEIGRDRVLFWALVRMRTRVLTAIVTLDERSNYYLSETETAAAQRARTEVKALAGIARLGSSPADAASIAVPEVKAPSPDSIASDLVGVQDIATATKSRLLQLQAEHAPCPGN
jgi:uncharacterized membrane protein YccC